MNVFKWILLSFYFVNSLVVIGSISKRRNPITPGIAVGVVILMGILALLVVLA